MKILKTYMVMVSKGPTTPEKQATFNGMLELILPDSSEEDR